MNINWDRINQQRDKYVSQGFEANWLAVYPNSMDASSEAEAEFELFSIREAAQACAEDDSEGELGEAWHWSSGAWHKLDDELCS